LFANDRGGKVVFGSDKREESVPDGMFLDIGLEGNM